MQRTINEQIRDLATRKLTVEQILDEGVSSYAQYFDFNAAGWQATPAELAAYRAIIAGLDARAGSQATLKKPVSEKRETRSLGRTQLWEPCERCGSEPSYLTARGHLCESCNHLPPAKEWPQVISRHDLLSARSVSCETD